MKRAIYPGTFDPITYGHLDILQRGKTIFDEIIIAVARDSGKKPLFSVSERIKMVHNSVKKITGVTVESFEGLLVNYAKEKNAFTIIRGLREVSDFEYEFQMALMNRRLDGQVETVFLMPNEKYTYLTSSIVREVASLKGDVRDFVPPSVNELLKKKIQKVQSRK